MKSWNPNGVRIIAKVLGMLGISERASAGAMGNAGNHRKLLENIGVPDDLEFLNPHCGKTIEKVLGILGISVRANAGAMGSTRNH